MCKVGNKERIFLGDFFGSMHFSDAPLFRNDPGRHSEILNIARGTTDPEIDSVTWTEFSEQLRAFALVSKLAIR